MWGRIFRNAEEVRGAVQAFVARYNEHWLLEKNASRSPARPGVNGPPHSPQ